MVVLLVCLGSALLSAAVASGISVAWWHTDTGAPRLSTQTVETEVRRHVTLARWVRAHLTAEAATGSLLLLIAVVTVVGGGAFGVIIEMVRTRRGFADFDASAARFGAHHATAASTHILRLITQIGGAYVVVPLAIVVGIVELRRVRSWATIPFLLVVVGGQYVLADVIKVVVDRARPNVLRLTGFSGPSFPSGHAVASSAAFAAFALLIGRGRSPRVRVALAAVSVGGAVLIAATRVVLGVHWLTDVLAGLCLGWTWFAICSIAFGGRRLSFGTPMAIAERAAGEPPAPPPPGTEARQGCQELRR